MTEPLRNLLPPEPLSHAAKIVLLTRIAHLLTVSARATTYEVGTDNVLQPQLLRAYNELIHRVTGSIRDHVEVSKHCMPFETVIEMMGAFGEQHGKQADMTWVVRQALSRPLPTEH